MNYLEFLDESARKSGSILCFGIDPDLSQMPPEFSGKNPEEAITGYFFPLIDAALGVKPGIGAIKPNYAYFAQYGFEGLRALQSLILRYKGKLPIILDAKRGDIGRSSEAYAREAFDFWDADAVTVSPYMGTDSVKPFLERCLTGKGAYILCRTSNSGASDFQSIRSENGKPVFAEVAARMEKWYVPGMGAVMGATALDELELAIWGFYDSRKKLPLLVPGVGAQGASAAQTSNALRTIWKETLPLHRINSSSAISYAYKKKGGDYVEAALLEIRRLNSEIGPM